METQNRGRAATRSPSLFREAHIPAKRGEGFESPRGFESFEGSAPPLHFQEHGPPHMVAIDVNLLAESIVATLRGGGLIWQRLQAGTSGSNVPAYGFFNRRLEAITSREVF